MTKSSANNDYVGDRSRDIRSRRDIEGIVARFYDAMLNDSIIGFIFTDVAKIELEHHLPIIVDFWEDSLFRTQHYNNNTLQKHVDISRKMPLTPGHFTRWLYLFNRAVDANHAGDNARTMKLKAERVAKAISAAISERKKGDMHLVLGQSND